MDIVTHKIPLDLILIGDRFRKDYGDIDELCTSFQEVGQIQPVIVTLNAEGKPVLVAGGRRCAAAKKLGWTEIAVALAPDEAKKEIVLRMMELEENLRRKEMTWKEKCSLVAEVHRLHEKEAHLAGEKWSRARTGELLNIAEGNVVYSVQMATLLKDPDHPVQKAESLTDAFRIVMQLREDEVKKLAATKSLGIQGGSVSTPVPTVAASSNLVASIISQTIANAGSSTSPATTPSGGSSQGYAADRCVACEGTGKTSKGDVCPICKGATAAFKDDTIIVPFSSMFYLGDCLSLLDRLPESSIDHILSDPPYAIDMDYLNQQNPNGGMVDIDRVAHTHDVEENLVLLNAALPKLFRVLKDKSYCVLFYDNVHWEFLSRRAEEVGFKVQRWPLVWCKTSACQNQCANFNWTKSTEFAIVLRKGIGTLVAPQPNNFWLGSTPDKKEFDHPFAKPPQLLEWILRGFAHPGNVILDPFMGSGTTAYASAKLGLRPMGFEKDEKHFNEALRVMRTAYTAWMLPKKVEFK